MLIRISLLKPHGRVRDDVETHWMKSLSSKLKQQQKQSNHKNLEGLLAARSKTFI